METCWNVSSLGYIYKKDNDLPRKNHYSILYELENLFIEGKVDKIDMDYIIHHDIAASLDINEREVLHLPSVFPYIISIKNKGNLSNTKFHYVLSFLDFNGKKFINPEINESYIKLSAEVDYIFNRYQYDVVRNVKRCNEEVKKINHIDALMFNCENLAQIKKSAQKSDIKLNEYLNSKNIIVPDKLSIGIEYNSDGDYLIKPILLETEDGTSEPVKDTASFNQAFKKQEKANSTYIGADCKIYIMKSDIKEGLQEIKDKGKIKKEDIKRIEKQPKEVFTSKIFDFNLGDYSDRVISIGNFVRKSLPYLCINEGKWLPEEGVMLRENGTDLQRKDLLPSMNRDNIIEIMEMLKRAQDNNKSDFFYNGKFYPITECIIQKATEVFERFFGNNDVVDNEETVENYTQTKTFLAFNIKDNIDELEYESRKRIYEIVSTKMFIGLNKNIQLYDHQKKGVQWMFNCWKKGHRGVLLSDDMGLGKTVQAYTFISSLKLSSPNQNINSVLVVAPVSLLKNWENEFHKFICPHVFAGVVKLYSGAIRNYRVSDKIDLSPLAKNQLILTTYETLRNYQISMGCIKWSVMIIDEAQKIKNPATMITTAVKAMQYDFAIALTGTPVENTWNDLWSIMDFVAPGKLGSLKQFHQKYQGKIKKAKKELIVTLGEKLQQELFPVFLRRLKSDILNDLPKKNIIKLELPMPSIQQAAYENVIRNARSYNGKMAKGQILKVIAQLRDVSLCPYLEIYKDTTFMNWDMDKVINSSARLKATFETLDKIRDRDEKVIVFITSRKMQRILKYLIENKYRISIPPAINGSIQSERRQEIIYLFNTTQGFNVLLLSVEAGGVGFNITSANNVIHLSRCWNPAKEDQATDRIYRIGQKKNVNVYLPIAYDNNFSKEASFDEKLDNLLEYKRRLSESVLYPTGDNPEEAIAMFKDIFKQEPDITLNEVSVNYGIQYWTIDDMVDIEGVVFEKIIGQLFENMGFLNVEVTPASNDKGADIVVKKNDGKTGFLIQCKQTSIVKNMNQSGIVEVYGALSYYGHLYKRQFEGIVVTNAKGYTENAYELATSNHVRLIAHDELDALLKKFPIRKF